MCIITFTCIYLLSFYNHGCIVNAFTYVEEDFVVANISLFNSLGFVYDGQYTYIVLAKLACIIVCRYQPNMGRIINNFEFIIALLATIKVQL